MLFTTLPSYRRQKLFTLREHLCSFPVGSVLLIFLVFCAVLWFYLSLSCVLCTQCCQCLWIVHCLLPLRFSLAFILVLLKEDMNRAHIQAKHRLTFILEFELCSLWSVGYVVFTTSIFILSKWVFMTIVNLKKKENFII